MEIKGLILILFALLLAGCSFDDAARPNLETMNFYKYAYTICVGSAFEGSDVKEDANRSAAGYMEQANVSLDAYQELRERIGIWLAKDYVSKSGKSLQLMKCGDFYSSGEIQEIYNKYDPCSSREGWLDMEDFHRQCD